MDLVAYVPPDLVDLVPPFRANRGSEVNQLRDAMERRDLERVRNIGERMFSVGNPFGFRQITTFGRQLRDACDTEDLLSIAEVVRLYKEYLAAVEVRFGEDAPKRPVWTKARRAEEASEKRERPTVRPRTQRRF